MEIDERVFYISCIPPVQEPEKLIKQLIEEMKIVERMNIIIREIKEGKQSGYLVYQIVEVERLLKMQGFSSKEIEYLFKYIKEECMEKGYMINEEFTDIMMSIFGERITERKRIIDRAYEKYEKPIIKWTKERTKYIKEAKNDIITISME